MWILHDRQFAGVHYHACALSHTCILAKAAQRQAAHVPGSTGSQTFLYVAVSARYEGKTLVGMRSLKK